LSSRIPFNATSKITLGVNILGTIGNATE
jgi:hypothetical protein